MQPFLRWKRILVLLLGIAALGGVFAAQGSLRATWHVARARGALASRDADAALRHLRTAERLAPASPETQFLLARAFRRRGEFDSVRTHLERAARLGYSRQRLEREQWLVLAQAGQFSQVERHLSALLQDPQGDGPDICEAFVDGYFATYQFSRAWPLLEAWQADHPADPQPHAFRGLYYEHMNAWSDAAESYRTALGLAPARRDLRGRLARLLVRVHDYAGAMSHFREVLEQEPDDPDLLSDWGRCLLGVGREEESRAVFARILERNPDHFGARLGMGQIEQLAGRPGEALAWLQPACDERPSDTEARSLLAQALQADGQTEAARPHFEFVAKARDALAEVHRLTERIRTHSDDYESRYRVGVLLLEYDEPAHGAAWLRSVLEFRPDHPETHRKLAAYYARIGNVELARRHEAARQRTSGDDPAER